MADLTPDSFMESLKGASGSKDLTPDSFMATLPKPEESSLNPIAEGFRRVGAMVLGTEQKPTALGEVIYPMTATDSTRRRDLNAARSPMDAPPILDISQLGGSAALPAGVARGAAQGVEEFMSGLTSPTNVMLMGGMGLLKAAPTLQKLASAGFSVDMLMGAYRENQNFQAAVQAGDSEAAARSLVGLTGSAAMGVAAARHAVVDQPGRMRLNPDTPADREVSRVMGMSNEDLAIARVDPAQASPAINQEIANRQRSGQWDKTLEKTPSPEERRAAKKAQQVSVPEEGDPDPIGTYMRGNVAAELAGKPYDQLSPEERSAVDDLVKQGFGMREVSLPSETKPAEAETKAPERGTTGAPAETPAPVGDTPVGAADVRPGGVDAKLNSSEKLSEEAPPAGELAGTPASTSEALNAPPAEAGAQEGASRFLDSLNATGKEASARLGKRLSKTSSANEFLNPETIRDMALSIAGDVARGVLKAGDIGRHLSKTYGPKARAVAAKVWAEVQRVLSIDGRGTREQQLGSVTIGPVEPKPQADGAAPPKQTATAEAPAPPADNAIPVSPSYEKTKGKILDKAAVSEESKAALSAEMQKWEAANPERKRITHAEIAAEAKKADPTLLLDQDRKTAQDTVIKDPALYHAARQLTVTLADQAAALNEQIRNAAKGTDTLELEKKRDQAEHDMQQLLGITLGVRSQHGRNLAMHRMMVDTAGFDPGYWAARAKKGLGLPADANLPPDVARDIAEATAAGRSAEADALGKIREQGAKRKQAEAAGAPVPKRKAERDPAKQKPTPKAEPIDTATPPTPEEKAAIDADPAVQEAKRKLARKMAKIEKTTLLEAISSIRRAGLLTSPRTHMRNFIGNGAMLALEETSRIPAAVLDSAMQVFGDGRTVSGPSTKAMARASREAVTKGWEEFKQVMRQGGTNEQFAQFDMPKEMNLGNGKASQVLEMYVNGVFRFMSATDRLFKRYAIQRSLEEQMKLAKVDSPTEAMMAQAIADADFSTFNNPNVMATMYSRARAGAPASARFAMDMAVPFVRTPANVLARVVDYSGGGLVRAGITGAKAALDKSLTPEQRRYIAMNFGRGVTGPALIYLGYKLAENGYATGSYQPEAGKRNTEEVAGRLNGAVRFGDTWEMVSPLSPAGALITIGATLQREATGPLRDEAKRPGRIAAVAGGTVLDHPFLQGAKDITEAISDPGRSGERALARMAGSFVPTIVSDAASLGDSVRRDARTDGGFVDSAAAAIAARTPGLRNTLPERKDVLGRSQPQSPAAVINPGIGSQAKESSDPIARELVRNKVTLSEPQRISPESEKDFETRRKKDRNAQRHQPETLDEFRMRREIVGREIEKQLGREIQSAAYSRLETEEERRNALDKAEGRARRLVAAKLGKRYASADPATRNRMLTELLKAPQ